MCAQALDEEQAFTSHMCQEQPFADSDLANTCFGSRSCPSKKSPSLAASPTRADDQGLDGSMAVASDRGPTRQLGELAHERSGFMYGDQLPLSGVVLGDLRPASITASPWATDSAQGLARLDATDLAKPAQPLGLGRLKNGKGLVPADFEDRRSWGSPDGPLSTPELDSRSSFVGSPGASGR